jgi:hypothetical protein
MTKTDPDSKKTPHCSLGSSFDDFLRYDNLYENTIVEANKQIQAMQVAPDASRRRTSKRPEGQPNKES